MDKQTAALAISTIALVPSIYGAVLPPVASVRKSADVDGHLAASERYALVTAVLVVASIGVITQTPEVLMIGGIGVLAFHVAYSNARAVTP